jgi:hypothetical protein
MNQPLRSTSRRGALLLGALLVATGCATTKRVPLGEADAQRLKTVRPVAALSQQEVKTSIVPSTSGAAFGLIGAIVDASSNNSSAKTAEEKVVPVRNALIGWEAGEVLKKALEREVLPIAVLHASKIEVQQLPDAKDAIAALVAGTKEDALFLLQTDYRLSPTFDRMVITAKASLIPARLPPTEADKAAAAEGEGPKPLYANTFVTSTALPGFVAGKTTMSEAAALWAADQGGAARSALDGGMSELARMIAFDVQQVGPAGKAEPPKSYDAPPDAKALTSVGPMASGSLTGFAVRQEKGRAWLRVASGELAAVEAP